MCDVGCNVSDERRLMMLCDVKYGLCADGEPCSTMLCDVKWIVPLRPDLSFVLKMEVLGKGLSDLFESTQYVLLLKGTR